MAPKTWLAAIVAAVTLASPALADSSAHVPEPAGLWTGLMVGDTPRTLAGAQVIDVPTLERLLAQEPVLIDVGPADRKPEGLPADVVWKPIHRSIPGAAWFPGAGPGDLPAEKANALLRSVEELTNGDKSTPVVTFCQPRCWGSWNVGKRLIQAGYTSVHWLPAGVSGWQEGNETVVVEPQPGWEPKPAASQGGS